LQTRTLSSHNLIVSSSLFLLSLFHYSSLLLSFHSTMTDTNAALQAAVEAMHTGDNIYDVTIVCTTDDHQAAYWMDRLAAGICSHATKKTGVNDAFPMVLAVSEDWGGAGAGNGLGTLYAFQKAHALAMEKYGVDLTASLEQGKVSAGLFHTAGKGTRMAPLPASENNNKPGVVCCLFVIACRDNQTEAFGSDSVLPSDRTQPPPVLTGRLCVNVVV
jgi:hypothetical protein